MSEATAGCRNRKAKITEAAEGRNIKSKEKK
jgi:hypothetical protein